MAACRAVIAAVSLGSGGHAGTFDFGFTGPGVSGSIDLTYGAAMDSVYSNAFVVTGISGTFTNSNIGILNAPIGMIEPRNFAMAEPGNLLAANSFSRFAVATGLPAVNNGFLTYDNLFWPGGSPPTATDYPFGGGFLDIYRRHRGHGFQNRCTQSGLSFGGFRSTVSRRNARLDPNLGEPADHLLLSK